MKYALFFMSLIFLFTGCQSEKGPEKTLKEFIDYRFSKSQTKEGVLNFVTGAFEDKIINMKDIELKSFLDSSKIVKKKIKIKVRKCNEQECFFTYILSYKQSGKDDYEVDVKKIAELQLVDEKWKVVNVSNIKTYIESIKGLNVDI